MAFPSGVKSHAADSALVQSARDGNRTAFGELYERYKRMVHGILPAHVPYCEAEDLMQTVFVQALQRLPQLRELESFGRWLAAIARNLASDHHRQRRNLVDIDKLKRADSGLARSGESQAALEAIRPLPEAYRETLMLRLAERMTGPEIAARTSLTPD